MTVFNPLYSPITQQQGKVIDVQRIFYMFGGMHRSSASAMAELLGFNPELVLPHLDQELGKTARNRSSSTPQR